MNLGQEGETMRKRLKGLITNDGLLTPVMMQQRSRHMNSQALKIPPSRIDYHVYSYFPRTRREWSCLPEDIVNIQSVDAFESELEATG